MLGGDDRTIGVQVKRTKHNISVEQIRAFTGALVLGGYTKGIFVTTSSFASGVRRTAELAKFRATPIELMDSKRFYDALKLVQRPFYRNKEELIQHILDVKNH